MKYTLNRDTYGLPPFFDPLKEGDVVEIVDENPTDSDDLVVARRDDGKTAMVQRDWLIEVPPMPVVEPYDDQKIAKIMRKTFPPDGKPPRD
jgi:hypothetical protein